MRSFLVYKTNCYSYTYVPNENVQFVGVLTFLLNSHTMPLFSKTSVLLGYLSLCCAIYLPFEYKSQSIIVNLYKYIICQQN